MLSVQIPTTLYAERLLQYLNRRQHGGYSTALRRAIPTEDMVGRGSRTCSVVPGCLNECDESYDIVYK